MQILLDILDTVAFVLALQPQVEVFRYAQILDHPKRLLHPESVPIYLEVLRNTLKFKKTKRISLDLNKRLILKY